ncbi:hypothetical protein BDV32DRAFT_116540 [Aspergillus pseudonomiae]|nr:hypothetical protein BDV32DRAFT_116540 [Aspergillus pseudonomiae]
MSPNHDTTSAIVAIGSYQSPSIGLVMALILVCSSHHGVACFESRKTPILSSNLSLTR